MSLYARSFLLPYACYRYYYRSDGPVHILSSLKRADLQAMQLRCPAYYAF
jgi:hypothetical protein